MAKKTESEIEFLKNLEERFEETEEVKEIADKLTDSGFEPYLVGGCLRDLLLGKKPKDWDLTTNAAPEQIQKVFPESVYENKFGTVAVKTAALKEGEPRPEGRGSDPTLAVVEITTFRKEGKYTDKRHPDEIKFAKTVEEDLARRDFTINAIAYQVSTGQRRVAGLVDPFGGRKDLEQKLIRAVGNPTERFQEDALRLMRAVRLATQLGFEIEEKTAEAIKKEAGLLEFIAKERITQELEKLLMAENAGNGIRKMEELDLLKYVMPELREGIEMDQNMHHQYTVFEHNVHALEYAVSKKFPLYLRLASLLHDVGKPKSRDWKAKPDGTRVNKGERGEWTFHQHQYIGEKMVVEMLDRLKFPKKEIEKIALLVREHMFAHDPDVGTLRGARRLVNRVGAENLDDLMKLREADRIGSGVEVAVPYRLRHFKAMIERAMQAPISAKMLKVNGKEVMDELGIDPGPRVGAVLAVLLDKVLDSPEFNDKEKLLKEVKKLGKLSEKEISKMRESAEKHAAEAQERIDEAIMAQYRVKSVKKSK